MIFIRCDTKDDLRFDIIFGSGPITTRGGDIRY